MSTPSGSHHGGKNCEEMRMTTAERIAARVVVDINGCHLWTGAKTTAGYGLLSVGNIRYYVHRLTYQSVHGPMAPDVILDHLCRVRHCCNPAHLEPVSRGENVLRGISPPAMNARKTVFSCGHPATPDNTYYLHCRMERLCKQCANRKNKERYRAKRREVRAHYDIVDNRVSSCGTVSKL